MLTLMDWLVQLEHRNMLLTRTGRDRLAQLAYSEQEHGKTEKKAAGKLMDGLVTQPRDCCQATTA